MPFLFLENSHYFSVEIGYPLRASVETNPLSRGGPQWAAYSSPSREFSTPACQEMLGSNPGSLVKLENSHYLCVLMLFNLLIHLNCRVAAKNQGRRTEFNYYRNEKKLQFFAREISEGRN